MGTERTKERRKEHTIGFYVEMAFVVLGVAAVLAWLGALVYVLAT